MSQLGLEEKGTDAMLDDEIYSKHLKQIKRKLWGISAGPKSIDRC